MATIIFYEKPGCATNARQRRILAKAGHTVIAKSLLTEVWTRERLLGFLEGTPVHGWFNPAAPAVKAGLVDPLSLDEESAIGLMLADSLLIRRPLLEIDGGQCVGFDIEWLDGRIGLELGEAENPRGCSRHEGSRCKDPGRPGEPARP